MPVSAKTIPSTPTRPPTRPPRVRANPERLAADRELYELLKAARFTGPRWEQLQDELWRYGWNVLRAWMQDGSVIERCRARHIFFPAPYTEVDEIMRRAEIREEIAATCVHRALTQFTELLATGYWKPDKGATFRTFFIGTCLFYFRDAYKHWAASYRRNVRLHLGPDALGEAAGRRDTRLGPAELVLLRDTLDRILEGASLEARAVCNQLLTTGGTQEQIAQRLKTTQKSVERHLSRVRARARHLAASGAIVVPSVVRPRGSR